MAKLMLRVPFLFRVKLPNSAGRMAKARREFTKIISSFGFPTEVMSSRYRSMSMLSSMRSLNPFVFVWDLMILILHGFPQLLVYPEPVITGKTDQEDEILDERETTNKLLANVRFGFDDAQEDVSYCCLNHTLFVVVEPQSLRQQREVGIVLSSESLFLRRSGTSRLGKSRSSANSSSSG